MKSYHQTRFVLQENRGVVWRILAPYLQRRFPLGDRILDLGCGYGDFINNISGVERFAIDASAEVSANLDPQVQFRQLRLPGDLAVFGTQMSAVFASNLLEHLERAEIDDLLSAAFDVLDPGGVFVSLTPNFSRCATAYFNDFTHLTPLTDVGLADWLSSKGFAISFCHPGFMPFSIKDSRLPVTPFLVRAWLASPFKPCGKQMLLIATKPGTSAQ